MFKKMMQAFLVVGIAALTFGSLPALAADGPLSISADVGVFSQYIWRGYTLSDESIVIQPSVTLGYDDYGLDGFSLNVWGNFDTDYFDTGTDYNETDITLSYEWSYEIIDFGVGYIYYDLDGGDTQELYFSASFEGYLNPTFTFYRDVQAFKGWYVNIGIGHTYDVMNLIDLDLSASMGYYSLNDDGYNGLHDANVSASTTFAINDNMSITPSLSYIWAISSDAKDELRDYKGNIDHFVGGFTFSYSF